MARIEGGLTRNACSRWSCLSCGGASTGSQPSVMSCASPGEASVAVSADSASVLATGGTGLVGRSIVRRLLAAGRSVRILSRGGDFPAHPGVSICRGDVTCDKDLAAALHGCDAIIHC